jgi:hypothetical protein
VTALQVRQGGEFDFLALGGLVIRLDTGLVPFRKATGAEIHVSGAEFNTAANLSDCFGLRTAVASAMVDCPVGEARYALLTTFPGDTTIASLSQVGALATGGSARIQR